MTLTKEQLHTLPKIELHLHLDGSILPETLLELAQEQHKEPPAHHIEGLKELMSAPEDCTDLNQYLRTFDVVLPFMQTKCAIERVAYELIQQCAADNVLYVEVRFAPQLHTAEGLSIHQVYEAVIKGLRRGEDEFGVMARCIGICLRGHSDEQNMETIEAAAQYLNAGLVAVDLAGAEALFPPELYQAQFQRAQQLGLPITIHAGEAGGADNIATSIHQLGAVRIGHGVRLKEDQQLLQEIIQEQIPLECCPISNLQTKAVEGWAQYPLVEYMKQGIKVTVNTDNLTVSQTSLSRELSMLQQHCGLSDSGVIELQRNAVSAIFLEQPAKAAFIASFTERLNEWEKAVKAQ